LRWHWLTRATGVPEAAIGGSNIEKTDLLSLESLL